MPAIEAQHHRGALVERQAGQDVIKTLIHRRRVPTIEQPGQQSNVSRASTVDTARMTGDLIHHFRQRRSRLLHGPQRLRFS